MTTFSRKEISVFFSSRYVVCSVVFLFIAILLVFSFLLSYHYGLILSRSIFKKTSAATKVAAGGFFSFYACHALISVTICFGIVMRFDGWFYVFFYVSSALAASVPPVRSVSSAGTPLACTVVGACVSSFGWLVGMPSATAGGVAVPFGTPV